MVQVLENPGSISGRVGKAIGLGLSEQLPKEIERSRLSQGLKEFERNSEGMSPLQQYANIAGIPGITPSMMQALPEILKQQNARQSLKDQTKSRKNAVEELTKPSKNKDTAASPSLTTQDPIQATLHPYIPKSLQQLQQRAGELLSEQPGLYLDPKDAMNAAMQEDQQMQAQQHALEGQRTKQQDVQSRVEGELRKQVGDLGAKIPGNVYSDLENEAIESVSSGRLTEKQAAKEYGKKALDIAKDYQQLSTIGSMKLITRTPSGNKEALRGIINRAKERGDVENITNEIISSQKLSPSKANYLTHPIKDNKELNNTIMGIKDINVNPSFSKGFASYEPLSEEDKTIKTLGAAMKIAPKLKNTDSILAVAEELKSKGYDPKVFVDYVDKNRKKLKLTEEQGRELSNPRDFTSTIDDMWMFYFSGLDPIVEIK